MTASTPRQNLHEPKKNQFAEENGTLKLLREPSPYAQLLTADHHSQKIVSLRGLSAKIGMVHFDLNKILCLTVLIVSFVLGNAQAPVTLKFTGKNQFGQHATLNSVTVENVTRHWQEVLYYPDTTLIMGTTGIEDVGQGGNGVRLFQNVPNPFDGVTDFALYLPEASAVTLEICDLNGNVTANYSGSLDPGGHRFRSWFASPQTYLLNARTDDGTVRIKMVNAGHAGQNRIEYLGKGSISPFGKADGDSKGSTDLPFSPGDLMSYKGYALFEGTQYESAPVERQQYNFHVLFYQRTGKTLSAHWRLFSH